MGRDQQRLGLAAGTTGAVLGSATYARLTTVAVVMLPPPAAPGASPAESPQPEPTTSVPQAPQAATDAWMHFQSDTGDYIGGGKGRGLGDDRAGYPQDSTHRRLERHALTPWPASALVSSSPAAS